MTDQSARRRPTTADVAPRLLRGPGVALLGWLLTGGGIALQVRSGLGVAPYDVLTTGLANRLHIQVGIASWLLSVIVIVVAWVIGQSPNWGTLAGSFVVGLAINASLSVVGPIHGLPAQTLIAFVALVTVWLGIVAIITSNQGAGPSELLMLAVAQHGAPMGRGRIAIEVVTVVSGFALGGSLGVGTVAFALLIGHGLAWGVPRAQRLVGPRTPART